MQKKKVLFCTLFLILTAICSVALAANPYASILAYNQNTSSNQNSNKPQMNTLNSLDIINMTPWEIYIGPPKGATGSADMFHGFAAAPGTKGATPLVMTSFYVKGINPVAPANSNGVTGNFAYHSTQISLMDMNTAWIQSGQPNATAISGYSWPTAYLSIPIVFNSIDGKSAAAGGSTESLNFMVTSSKGFDVNYASNTNRFAATTLSFGDGVKNYGWESYATMAGTNTQNVTQFLTLQAPTAGTAWTPITQNLASVTTVAGSGGTTPGTQVKVPQLLNVAGMVYPQFSTAAGGGTPVVGQTYDLVVILQAGDFADCALIFVAVPSSANSFLPGAGAIRR